MSGELRRRCFIRSASLGREVAEDLDPWVRGKFLALWELAQAVDPF